MNKKEQIPQQSNIPNPEVEKVKTFPVEQLISEIKPRVTKQIEGVDYYTTSFNNPFVRNFLVYYVRPLITKLEVFDEIRQKTKDQILVDLGSSHDGLGYFLSVVLGYKGYVAVERFHHDELKDRLENMSVKEIKSLLEEFKLSISPDSIRPETRIIPASIESDDMLSFLQRLPDGSVSCLTSGISIAIIPHSYSDALSKEIQRVLSPTGLYITYESDIPVPDVKGLSGASADDKNGNKLKGFYTKMAEK